MIPYIGDISREDAFVLKEFAEKSSSILEFGCGASTQVLSKYSKNEIISIDTSQEWIDKTIKNIRLLEIEKMPLFKIYNNSFVSGLFDFVFNDGIDEYRKKFALDIWHNIKIGGILSFHDTRRWQDYKYVTEFIYLNYNEISKIYPNYKSSNITLITKKEEQPYVNWQETENKEQWQIGYGNPDINYIKSKLNE